MNDKWLARYHFGNWTLDDYGEYIYLNDGENWQGKVTNSELEDNLAQLNAQAYMSGYEQDLIAVCNLRKEANNE